MSHPRRDVLKMLSSTAIAASAQPALRAAGPLRPNILIVMSDQERAGLTRRSGFPLDTMPRLDRLAAEGVVFDRAYTTAPLCVPARVSMLTGRWPHAHRVRQNSAARYATFQKDLFHVCREEGYRTGLAGKNHSHLTKERVDFWRTYMHLDGWMPENPPTEHVEFQKWMGHLNHGVSEEPSPYGVEAQFPYRIVSDAIEFVGDGGDKPFALWVSFPEPHNPYQVPKPYFDMFPPEAVPPRDVGPEALGKKGFKWQWLHGLEERTYPDYENRWRRTRSNYLGMLRLIDDQVARLLGHLESTGVLKNTIVLYLADHGDYFCDYGLERKGAELPEVLARIPMVWAGRGVKPQPHPDAFVSTADVLPTICEAIGAPIPAGAQGRSLWPILEGKPYPRDEFETVYAEVGFGGMYYGPDDAIDPNWGKGRAAPDTPATYDELNPVTQSGSQKMVRRGEWKLTFDMLGNGQIFNVAKDPYELDNLYGKPAAAQVQPQLMADLLRWTIRTQDDLPVAAYKPNWPTHNWVAPYARKGKP